MARKQHESRQDQDSPRKGQISDESGRKDLENLDINFSSHESIQKLSENALELGATSEEETKKNGIHFYTLSIMNETNKVNFIKSFSHIKLLLFLDMFSKLREMHLFREFVPYFEYSYLGNSLYSYKMVACS